MRSELATALVGYSAWTAWSAGIDHGRLQYGSMLGNGICQNVLFCSWDRGQLVLGERFQQHFPYLVP